MYFAYFYYYGWTLSRDGLLNDLAKEACIEGSRTYILVTEPGYDHEPALLWTVMIDREGGSVWTDPNRHYT